MAKYGKWIGGGLGWTFGGPIGGILGFIFGSMLDSMTSTSIDNNRTRRNDFGVSLLVLTAAIMKADGKVLKSELDFVKTFFVNQFGAESAQQQIPLLKEILKQNIHLQDVSIQIKQYMEYPSRLQLLHFLWGIAGADGSIHQSEIEIIKNIAYYMGITNNDFESIKAMFIKNAESSYKILEITVDATDEEVKKAYRKMAIKYHPDKVQHLGEEFQNAAHEKFQKVNEAYETIKKQRGII